LFLRESAQALRIHRELSKLGAQCILETGAGELRRAYLRALHQFVHLLRFATARVEIAGLLPGSDSSFCIAAHSRFRAACERVGVVIKPVDDEPSDTPLVGLDRALGCERLAAQDFELV